MAEYLPDEIDYRILACLAQDARMSLKALSHQIGLSSPSTAERLKRLEEKGVVEGYTLNASLPALGYSLQAIVRVKPLPGLLHKVEKLIQGIPQCIECDKITGDTALSCVWRSVLLASWMRSWMNWRNTLRAIPPL